MSSTQYDFRCRGAKTDGNDGFGAGGDYQSVLVYVWCLQGGHDP